MKSSVKKILFIFVYLIAILVLFLWRMPLVVQTNLNSLTEIHNTNWPINELTTKFSNVVNIVVKSENLGLAEQTAGSVLDALSTDEFANLSVINTNVSISDAIAMLAEHKNSFLSSAYRSLLQKGEFASITDKAVATISTSMAPSILSLSQDPFLLATNYLQEFKSTNTNWENRDGFLWQYQAPYHYILISANVDTSDNNVLVANMNSLSKVLHKYDTQETKIFMSGIPV